jgi:D-arabinose 1-dehydrogenase-like Zn-dependent alcohol dehydrogenase
MTRKMKTAVVVRFGKPLELQEWTIPTPEPDQILVKADIELQPLSAINWVLERLEHGNVASRVVLDFAKG